MKRIYCETIQGETFEADKSTHHYLKNVLRIQRGDEIEVLTPDVLIHARVAEVSKNRTLLQTVSSRSTRKPDYSLTVYLCILKREYMDTCIEKLTELGATEIVPVTSERSLSNLKDKTKDRFTEISKKAALQCENEFLPDISDEISIRDITARGEAYIFYERGESPPLPEKMPRDVSIIIGPEGGFTDDEAKMCADKGFRTLTPVSQILKAETAAVVFTGMVRMLQEKV